MKSGVFLVAFCARLKTYGAFFGDKNHKAFSRFCLCGHEKSGLRDEFEILIEELRFTFLAIDVDDEDAFSALKRLQQISHHMKGSSLEYEDKKSLFRFLWSICSGFSFITGYREPDYIEKIISSV